MNIWGSGAGGGVGLLVFLAVQVVLAVVWSAEHFRGRVVITRRGGTRREVVVRGRDGTITGGRVCGGGCCGGGGIYSGIGGVQIVVVTREGRLSCGLLVALTLLACPTCAEGSSEQVIQAESTSASRCEEQPGGTNNTGQLPSGILHENSVAAVRDDDRADHVDEEDRADKTDQQAQNDEDAPDELYPRGDLGSDLGHGCAHLVEIGLRLFWPPRLELLPTVSDEHNAQNDATKKRCNAVERMW